MNSCPACGIDTTLPLCPSCGHATDAKAATVLAEVRAVAEPLAAAIIVGPTADADPNAPKSLAARLVAGLETLTARTEELARLVGEYHAADDLMRARVSELETMVLTKPASGEAPALAAPDLSELQTYVKNIVARFQQESEARAVLVESRDVFERKFAVATLATKLLAAWTTSDTEKMDSIAVVAAVGYANQIMHEVEKPWSPPVAPVVPVSAPPNV